MGQFLIAFVLFVNFFRDSSPFHFKCIKQQHVSATVRQISESDQAYLESSIELINNVPDVSIEEILRKDLVQLKYRLDRLEKSIVTGKIYKPVSSFIESITANTIELNTDTIQTCSFVSFFFIGSIIAFSISDRFWLLGGIFLAVWSTSAVHQNTRGGNIARRVGVQLAQLVRDIQERVNQFVIFYRTGKLAYFSSKWWEQYDQQFMITKRMDKFKRLTMMRAVEYKDAFAKTSVSSQLSDFYKVLSTAPNEAKRINEDFGISSKLTNFAGHVFESGQNLISDILSFTSDSDSNNKRNRFNRQGSGRISIFIRKLQGKPMDTTLHARNINPWIPFWVYLKSNKRRN